MKFAPFLLSVLFLTAAAPAAAQVYSAPGSMPYPYPGCPQLSFNLYRGVSDTSALGQVSQLQQFLSLRGYAQPVTGFYGSLTTANVAQFQREQAVYPITGGVGPLTRTAIARLCGNTPPPMPGYSVPSLQSVSGPTQLIVGQSGTWTVNATDASQYLTYAVTWGDEAYPAYAAAGVPVPVSSGTLSHAYARAGTYTATFTVTNAYGQSAKASVTVVVVDAMPAQTIFYSGAPFTLGVTQTAVQYQGQLQVTLNRINVPPYAYPWGYAAPTSASVTLGQGCPPGTYCLALWYPTQTLELTVGQSASFLGHTITLTALTNTAATFTVKSEDAQNGALAVSSPTTGQSYAHGSTLTVSWQSSIKVAGSVVLDLYTASGNKVGTIAIQNFNGNGAYNWSVPVPGTICTLQYPNGLCGQSLSGSYFIKASIVAGNGFESGASAFASANSGTFTIN